MKPADIESRLRQVAWPAPPADLRASVLSAVPVTVPAVSWSDRVWFSRAWRLAAVAVVLILAAVDSMSAPTRSAVVTVSPQAAGKVSAIAETARQAGLSPEQAAALARRAVAAERPARFGIGFAGFALDDLGPGGEPR